MNLLNYQEIPFQSSRLDKAAEGELPCHSVFQNAHPLPKVIKGFYTCILNKETPVNLLNAEEFHSKGEPYTLSLKTPCELKVFEIMDTQSSRKTLMSSLKSQVTG